MKFVTFQNDGQETLGWLHDQENVLVIDAAHPDLPQSMLELVIGGDVALKKIKSSVDQLKRLPLAEVELLTPLRSPEAIFCVGLNYAEHEREMPVPGKDYPILFLRLARNQVADKKPMITPTISSTLDWEGELVVVIGKEGRNIAAENAFDHIFGYSIYNDGSVRSYQKHTPQIILGKSFENTGAFGPCIVSADEFGDPYKHSLETRLDGEVVQTSSIELMTHRIEDVIAYISEATRLMPGDIICTGTPGGVGIARKPPRFMQAGETVAVTISGIGTLTNPIQAEVAS